MRCYNGFRKRGKILMKNLKRKILPLALLALGTGALAGCGQEPTPEPWYVISEKAMNNFLSKIQNDGYTIVGDEQTTSVHDQNMITWFFKEGSQYTDHAAVTINEETYYGFIDYKKNSFEQVVFMDKMPATQIDENMVYLPTMWLDQSVSGGNIWSLWHNNDQSNPLHYNASKSGYLYETICYFCNYDANTIPSHMQDVYMEFDKEDVHVATIKFKYNPGGTAELKDGLVTITFDEEVRTSDIVNNWLNDPNRNYPEPVGEYGAWPGLFDMHIESIYRKNLGYKEGSDPLPYDNFFSYATKIDQNKAKYHGIIEITDYHADESDAKQYMTTLKSNGYQAEIGVTGLVFRSPVIRDRDGYEMFSDVTLTINDGLVISAQRYYTSTSYVGRDVINDYIQTASTKYIALPDSENVTSWTAVDNQFAAYESRSCNYDVNLYLDVYLEYKDADAMTTYLDNYFKAYTDAGFVYDQTDGTYSKADQSSRTVVKLSSNDSGVADILFYNYRRILPSEAFPILEAAGYPAITVDTSKIESILENNGYERLIQGEIWTHYYWMTINFDSHQELLDFVNPYKDALLNAEFEEKPEAYRTCRYVNADESARLIMDYKGSTSTLNLWFGIK